MEKRRKIFLVASLIAVLGSVLFIATRGLFKEEKVEKIQASSLVTSGDFRLEAHNRWDESLKQSYADLEWDAISDLTEKGYQLYQSEDGNEWNNRSLNYGKGIKVLNIYPNEPRSNNLEGWMDSLGLFDDDNNDLIDVTPVSLSDYNSDPEGQLKNAQDEYIYDVLMFGTWDANFYGNLSENGYNATRDYINTGRGVLFGHDTLAEHNSNKRIGEDFFLEFHQDIGIGIPDHLATNNPTTWQVDRSVWNGSREVTITNDGYLMKYPYQMTNGQVLRVPLTHNIEISNKSVGTVWAEFTDLDTTPGWGGTIYDDGTWRSGWYLKTNGNIAMIQTGHSNGDTEREEREIIANTLYNLAQVSMENRAEDRTVKDKVKPKLPNIDIRCGNIENLNIRLDAEDDGTAYQWYVKAFTKSPDQEELTSDTVEEEIISNIAGYFYRVVDSVDGNINEDFKNEVIAKRDGQGQIPESEFDLYVAPNNNQTKYETAASFSINEPQDSEKYIQVIAVDRAGNVSEVKAEKISDLVQQVDFEIERTGDEAKIVDLVLNDSLDENMQSLEIQIPKNTVIKAYDSLNLPPNWSKFKNSGTADYDSYSFDIKDNNGRSVISAFLEDLRFTIDNDDNPNREGSIKIILHERVYTSWVDPDGVTHYYTFIPFNKDNRYDPESKQTWLEAYNSTKKLRYRGLTGYLATLTSKEEHDFVYENIAIDSGWIGGSRLRKKSSIRRINDDGMISEDINDYTFSTTDANDWYWVNGPEADLGNSGVFFNQPRYSSTPPTGAIADVYQGFANPLNNQLKKSEPSNGDTGEYVTQFGQTERFWNDIKYDNTTFVYGIYVEFSQYGDQVETEEVSDVCWKADIPQKISLKGFIDRGGWTFDDFGDADILYDQQLRIGNQITVQPKEIDLYEFIEIRDRQGDVVLPGVRPTNNYEVSNVYQEGALIYAKRSVLLHVRQVVLDESPQLVLPTEGYLNLRSFDGGEHGENHVEMPSEKRQVKIPSEKNEDVPTFETFVVGLNHMSHGSDELRLELFLPEFYEVVGNYLTLPAWGGDPDGVDHQNVNEENIYTNELNFHRDILLNDEEYFITIYLKPKLPEKGPQPYSWDYKVNEFGLIKTE